MLQLTTKKGIEVKGLTTFGASVASETGVDWRHHTKCEPLNLSTSTKRKIGLFASTLVYDSNPKCKRGKTAVSSLALRVTVKSHFRRTTPKFPFGTRRGPGRVQRQSLLEKLFFVWIPFGWPPWKVPIQRNPKRYQATALQRIASATRSEQRLSFTYFCKRRVRCACQIFCGSSRSGAMASNQRPCSCSTLG